MKMSLQEAEERKKKIAAFVERNAHDAYTLRRAAEMLDIIAELVATPTEDMWEDVADGIAFAVQIHNIRMLESAVQQLKRLETAEMLEARLDNLWERFIW